MSGYDDMSADDMNVAERRDLAMREVLGLLDAEEEARLGRAFDAMSPQDQAEILDLQAAIASEIGGLGDDRPDRALRYRVLADLAAEMDRENLDVSPIASIGGRRPAPRRMASSDGSDGGPDLGPAEHDASRRRLDRGVRSARVWRAATIAFAAAFLAVFVFQQSTQDSLDRIVVMLDSAFNQEHLRKDFSDRRDPNAQEGQEPSLLPLLESGSVERYALVSPDAGTTGAMLFAQYDRKGPTAYTLFVMQNQEEIRAFDLVGVASGQDAPIRTGITNSLQLTRLDLSSAAFRGFESIELRDSATGRVVYAFARQA